MKKKIETLEDIQLLVDQFYTKVRRDKLIGPIFNRRIGDQWPKHLEKMYRFWQTVLLKDHTYYGSPFPPHAQLAIEEKHFKRWITLFKETVEERFEGPKAEEALWRASKMAEMFQMKIEHIQKNDSHPLM